MERTTEILPHRLQFGSFEMDPHLRELRKHGLKVKIPPQAFCVLACLLENAGELVPREALFHRLWPADTHVEYEGNLNAIVRVLREALGDSARNPRFIETEPKLGYRFVAPVSSVAYRPAVQEILEYREPEKRRVAYFAALRWVIPALACLILASSWLVWSSIRNGAGSPQPHTTETQLTHFLGSAAHPTFSPDGLQVAFQWNGGGRGDYDIYVLRIGLEDPRRLTDDPADDTKPTWSPDGRDIAFLRAASGTQSALMLVPAMGGVARSIAVLPKVKSLAWSPDGKFLVYSLSAPDNELNPSADGGISAISLSTGQTMGITTPAKGFGESDPAFSRDGRQLAFISRSELWVLNLDANLKGLGQPRRATIHAVGAQNPIWMPDRQSILFTADRGLHGRLWKVAVGNRAVAAEEVGGEDAFEPSLDVTGRRLVYSRSAIVDSLNTLELCGTDCASEPPRKLLYSTKLARNPTYSPDGRKIAFESSRSGHMEIWICDSDGSHPRQLTNLGGPPAGTPNWSPDGRSLVFDAQMPAGSLIFTIPAAGGNPRQLTSGATEDLVPSWSHDGKRIYFCSKRTGTLQVWSMASTGEQASQITTQGGLRAIESFDRKAIYYSKAATQTSMWKVAVGGGEETEIVDSLSYWQNFSVTATGIYYVPVTKGRSLPIRFYNVASGVSRPVGSVDSLASQGIAASPDNRTLVFSRRESNDRDLMLMEFGR